ncbi:ribosome maturation factor RimP [Lapillicoccus sp.]|uniref:ribosome maturation factor RimP n=1 Tax=Lapillicoccus sp. TaxID=1909287 RepID=UPI0032637F87
MSSHGDPRESPRGNPQGDELAHTFAAALADLSLQTVDVTVTTAGTRRVLRVLVDRDLSRLDPSDSTSRVAPLDLDEVADATRAVTQVLDESDAMGERAYTLEVSSPGVGRPLSGHAALRRNVGRLVELTQVSGATVTGRLVAVEPDALVIEVPAGRRTPAERFTLSLPEVRSAQVQVEFNRSDDDSDEEED